MPSLFLKLLIHLLEFPTKSLVNHPIIISIGNSMNAKTITAAQLGNFVLMIDDLTPGEIGEKSS